VKGNSYACSKCDHISGRKYNAERHNDRMHDGLATIENIKIKSVSSLEPKTKNNFHKSKFKRFRTQPPTAKDDIFDELLSKYANFESGVDELKIMRIFGQLYPYFEELEKLLSHHKENEKADILTRILTSCFNSYRPVKSMADAVKIYRSVEGLGKMANYYAKSKNILPEMATKSLKDLVKNSAYFKNNIN
jgi:hypothetical protein